MAQTRHETTNSIPPQDSNFVDAMKNNGDATYVIGQGEEATGLFAQRTAEIEANFVLPFIRPNSRILDIGSGPGTITCDFAVKASKGDVVGVDLSPKVVENAEMLALKRGVSNVKFMTGNVVKGLPFEDAQFDVVFAHQVLVHLGDAVAALKEMKRVARPGAVIASRDPVDMFWYPSAPLLDNLMTWNMKAAYAAGAELCLSMKLPAHARQVGLKPINGTSRLMGQAFVTAEEKANTVALIDLTIGPNGFLTKNAAAIGLSAEDLSEMNVEFLAWYRTPDSWMSWTSLELIMEVA